METVDLMAGTPIDGAMGHLTAMRTELEANKHFARQAHDSCGPWQPLLTPLFLSQEDGLCRECGDQATGGELGASGANMI